MTLLTSIIGVVLIPVFILVYRAARRSGRIETQLSDLANSEKEQNKRIEIIFQNLDNRLRWIEERIWGNDPRYPRRRLDGSKNS